MIVELIKRFVVNFKLLLSIERKCTANEIGTAFLKGRRHPQLKQIQIMLSIIKNNILKRLNMFLHKVNRHVKTVFGYFSNVLSSITFILIDIF